MSRYLVLGACGFIGKAVTLKLAEGNKVTAFDRITIPDFDGKSNITSVMGNFTEMESFEDILEGIDCVIHLISTTVPSDDTTNIPQEIMNNVIPSVRLLEGMKNKGVKRIFFASSAGTYYGETGDSVNTDGSPANPYCSYGVQKVVIENYIKFYGVRYGIDYRIARISNPYGWGQDPKKMQGLIPIFCNKILKGEPVTVFGDGENKRDYIFISDLADGVDRILSYNGNKRIFNLGFGEYYSINEIIKMIEEYSQKKFPNVIYSENRFCDVRNSFVDMNNAHTELEWKPKINIKQGLKKTLDMLK